MTGGQSMRLFLLALATLACGREAEATGPDDVVLEFVASMRRVHGDVASGESVVQLLWQPARENLKERARRASALSGRELSSGEMIVPSWFALHVSPERVDVREDGDWAEVTVYGSGQDAVQMRCIKESGAWKVALELPPLAPIRQRDAEQ